MTYRPNPESLAGRVLGFLTLNPREQLSFEDIVAKFVDPGDHRNVHHQLMAACDHDLLAYDPDEEVYRKGKAEPVRTFNVTTAAGAGARTISQVGPGADDEEADPAPREKTRRTQQRRAISAMKSEANDRIQHHDTTAGAGAVDRPGEAAVARAVPGRDEERDRSADGAEQPGREGHGAEAGPHEAAGQPPVVAGRDPSAACAISERGSGGHSPGAGPASAGHQGDGVPAGPAGRAGPESAADWHRADDARHDLPQGVDGQATPAELASGESARAVARGAGALPSAGADREGSEGPGPAVDHSPIGQVRLHLLATLADLRNREAPMAVDRARAVAEVARELISSAKVEVEYLKVTQQRRGAFFEALPAPGGNP